MTQRMALADVVPAGYAAVAQLEKYARANVEPTVLHLIKIRASVLNGCAFCIDMHSTDALAAGESAARLFGLGAWRETPLYTAKEQAALALTDAATRFGEHGITDDVYDEAREHFDERELTYLVGAIAVINMWNRLAITFQTTPRSARAR